MAQDPVAAFPNNYKTVLDNDVVSMIRVHYRPHEKLGVHDHSRFPTIYVYLSEPFVLVRPATFEGAFRVSPGRLERHSVENLGGISSEFLRVELKQLRLGNWERSFRGSRPANLTQATRAIEFDSPEVQVQRIVCTTGTACDDIPPGAPSLLVAFSTLKVKRSSSAGDLQLMRNGDVFWVPGSEALSIVPESQAPAHCFESSSPALSVKFLRTVVKELVARHFQD